MKKIYITMDELRSIASETVEGISVHDPRDDTWKPSNNPALIFYDLVKRIDAEISPDFEAAIIDMADICDSNKLTISLIVGGVKNENGEIHTDNINT